MIKFITAEDALPIRSQVLRDGKISPQECLLPQDNEESSFHLGYFQEYKLVTIATFHLQSLTISGIWGEVGYQLRGMATLRESRRNGAGNQLINFAIIYLRGQKVNYLWCNARRAAFGFYQNLGFEFISDEFEIPGIGPHKMMYLKIQ